MGTLKILYAVFQEVATNDLKYGFGPADWKFRREGNDLHINIEAKSNYAREGKQAGQGRKNIDRRLSEIGGTIRVEQNELTHITEIRIAGT